MSTELERIKEIHGQLIQVLRMGQFSRDSRRRHNEETARLTRSLPGGDLTMREYKDLEWHFCETLADRIRDDYPQEAVRLYELAGQSYAVDGHGATGAGEGLQSVEDRKRVQRKAREVLEGKRRP